ncbi:ABC transporter ATP-binding protein [Geminicoccus flavidas]|uniref:ABC transporter ATP-binding protein n=1 Tax=Geminicoccus flavidas TaxID=2506407 RepID=UPI001F30D0BD|nr:ABC transporter ATP-binding protein [Geminicoccus flavidas]
MSHLVADRLTFLRGGRRLLDEVSATFGPGGMTGLIGPNGAGKTTLMRCLAGLVRPEQGQVRLDGSALIDWPARARARQLAYLPQAHRVHWRLSVTDLVMLGRLPHRRGWNSPGPADRAAVAEALAATDCTGLAARTVDTLSGGERARVLLARALAGKPAILLADEPTAGLDPFHQLEVMERLQSLARSGTTVLVVLHDLSAAVRFCDRLVLLDQGRVVAAGDPGEVTAARNLKAVFRIEAVRGQLPEGIYLLPRRRVLD